MSLSASCRGPVVSAGFLVAFVLIAASFVFSVGYILLGVAIFRAGVLPRAAGVLLAAGCPLVAFAPPIGLQAILIVGHTLFGSGLALSGHALWVGAARTQPSGQRAV